MTKFRTQLLTGIALCAIASFLAVPAHAAGEFAGYTLRVS